MRIKKNFLNNTKVWYHVKGDAVKVKEVNASVANINAKRWSGWRRDINQLPQPLRPQEPTINNHDLKSWQPATITTTTQEPTTTTTTTQELATTTTTTQEPATTTTS